MKATQLSLFFVFIFYGTTVAPGYSLNQNPGHTNAVEKDSTKKPTESLDQKIKGMIMFGGLFTFYQDTTDGSLFMLIEKTQVGEEFVYFVQSVDGVVDVRFNRGSYRRSRIFSIQKYFNRIELVNENSSFYFDPSNALSRAKNANISPSIIASQKIVATDSLKNKYLIEADGFFLSENLQQIKPTPPPGNEQSKRFNLGSLNKEKSKYLLVKSYPMNSDVIVQYVYDNPEPQARGSSGITDPRSVNITLRHSFLEMPDNDYTPRFEDPRIGYFTTQVTDMTSTSVTPYRDLVHRWNLKKKNPEEELSEPEKPIVFWIENTTPTEFRSAVEEGVLGWNKSFEKAGFINAVQVKTQPDDAAWDAGDIRYNVLRWTSSPNPPFGGYGPSFVNPRTGEILGADIMLEYVYFTNRVKYDFLYKSEPFDKDVNKCSAGEFIHQGNLFGMTALNFGSNVDWLKKELVRQSLIRLVLHEVGHTIGLNHNFKSSHLHNNVDIHNKELTEKVGLTGSVMDYTPVNLSLDTEKQGQYYSTVPGTYDDWAIEFGYSPSVKGLDQEKIRLDEILSRSTNPELLFGNDADDMRSPGKGIDPRVMIGDMSNNPIEYSERRIALINILMESLSRKYGIDGESYHRLRDAFYILIREYGNSVTTVSRFVGGVYVDRSFVGQEGAGLPYEPVSYETQKYAMYVLEDLLFSPKSFEIPDALANYLQQQRRGFNFYGKTEDPKIHEIILGIQKSALNHLVHVNVLKRLSDSQLYGNEYTLNEMLNDLTNAVFQEDSKTVVNTFRQNLQAEYVNRLITISGLKKESSYDYLSQASALKNLKDILKLISKRSRTNSETNIHRDFLEHKILTALDHKQNKG
ncbi:uncharacterized protein METZ01_LOCUS55501 [marine metagenome]|uniref:EcxA zinc-binding domain-containing protein n=1 Tax=marine metagenome TaxID=408172 RepID=A0A381SJZ2_9ZZZZ